MTKKEVMVSAIRTAVANGFKREVGEKSIEFIETGAIDFGSAEGMLIVRGLLTEHRFAQALWGKQVNYYLQQLVITKDPIRYLETTL